MKRFFGFLTAAAFVGMLFAANALAQSSGSFNYSSAGGLTACVLNSSNGSISGGMPCGPISAGTVCTTTANCNGNTTNGTATCNGATACTSNSNCVGIGNGTCDTVNRVCEDSGTCSSSNAASCIGSTDVGIKTNSGSGNVFVVRPSAVIGLLTDVTVSSKQGTTATSSAFAGVDFSVSVVNGPNGNTTVPTPDFPVTYDSRFIQISTNLFQALQTQCAAITGGCFITFNESTVSAHSFDWVLAPLTSGNYDVRATWTSSLADFGIASSMTCVGPVNLTIQQNKIFKPSADALTDIGAP
jgi:hypothetical protein